MSDESIDDANPLGIKEDDGLRLMASWLSGEWKGKPFTLMTGAGMGSPSITFSIEGKNYHANVESVIRLFFRFHEDTQR